ncbi:MAG: hypothetical protein GEU79_12155 [Acidimicrobiia bacterium]|nr:hypothetical protein [Acidimicrobiia bacterium]
MAARLRMMARPFTQVTGFATIPSFGHPVGQDSILAVPPARLRRKLPPGDMVPMAIPSARLNPVFVLSSPRSGSTLVQRLLNAHPRLTIWGEHNGFLNPMAESYRLLTDPSANRRRIVEGVLERDLIVGPLDDPRRIIAWTNPLSPEEYRQQFRRFLFDAFTKGLPEDIRWGFKEVRYGRPVARFLLDLFPRSRFVFTSRDLEPHRRSRILLFEEPWDLDDPGAEREFAETLAALASSWIIRNENFVTFSENNPGSCLALRAGDLTDPSAINGVFSELDLDPVTDQQLGTVINTASGSLEVDVEWTEVHRDKLDRMIEILEFDDDAQQKVKRISEFFHL